MSKKCLVLQIVDIGENAKSLAEELLKDCSSYQTNALTSLT